MLKQLQSALNWRGFVAIFGFFLIWYLACILELPGFAEMANPLEVIQMFVREYARDNHYWLSWVTSFQRVLYGFLFAQLFGIPLGLLFGTNEKFRNLFFPVFELLRPIPPLAWDVVIAAEMIASDSGLGRLTWEGYVSSTPEVLVIGMISIGLAGYLSTKMVNTIERKMMPWRRVRR